MKTNQHIAKKIILLATLLVAATITVTTRQQPDSVYRYLKDSSGVEHKVVYIPQTNEYYFCYDSPKTKRKLQPGDQIERRPCDCSTENLKKTPPINPAKTPPKVNKGAF